MSDFKKIAEHPEKQKIIDRLLEGEQPKDLSLYLKEKYNKPDEAHLRLPATLLHEFREKYLQASGYIDKIAKGNVTTTLDKVIAQSLLKNDNYRKRIEEAANSEVDFKKKIVGFMAVVEARAEQLFDIIQSNPEATKTDHVFLRYIEQMSHLLEKADKIVNNKPDMKIEHIHSVQLVENHTKVFQEAIRRTCEQMGPEYTFMFMEILNKELRALNPTDVPGQGPPPTQADRASFISSIEKFEQKTLTAFEEDKQVSDPDDDEED